MTDIYGHEYICAGTTLEAVGYRREIEQQELPWLHGALTGVLGRSHGALSNPSADVSDFSILPWPGSKCGWAVAWWSVRDAERIANRTFTSRLGRVGVDLRFGPLVRVKAPPQPAPCTHQLRIVARTPVVIASTTGRRTSMREAGAPQTKVFRVDADAASISHALCGLARKVGAPTDGVEVRVVDRAVRTAVVKQRGRVDAHGWVGHVDVECSAQARWLLDAASRGLGLGGRVAFGCGAIELLTTQRLASSSRRSF